MPHKKVEKLRNRLQTPSPQREGKKYLRQRTRLSENVVLLAAHNLLYTTATVDTVYVCNKDV